MSSDEDIRDIFAEPTAAEKLASGQQESGFQRSLRRVKKWCPFGKK